MQGNARARFNFVGDGDNGVAGDQLTGEIHDSSLVQAAGGVIEILMTGYDVGNLWESETFRECCPDVIQETCRTHHR